MKLFVAQSASHCRTWQLVIAICKRSESEMRRSTSSWAYSCNGYTTSGSDVGSWHACHSALLIRTLQRKRHGRQLAGQAKQFLDEIWLHVAGPSEPWNTSFSSGKGTRQGRSVNTPVWIRFLVRCTQQQRSDSGSIRVGLTDLHVFRPTAGHPVPEPCG